MAGREVRDYAEQNQHCQGEGFADLECGGKRNATPLWMIPKNPKRRRRFALPAHSKFFHSVIQLHRTQNGLKSGLIGVVIILGSD